MPCLHPIQIFKYSFDCGWCSECCAKYARQWSQRIMDEFYSVGDVGCFVTLTYDDEHLPDDQQVNKRDFQLFMKRLRKAISPVKVRFFSCGEYGGKRNRPHYHVILFGWFPPDLYKVSKDRFGSDMLCRIWKNGFVSVGEVTIDSAKYCAKYLAKSDPRIHEVRPFTNMSRRPGIGASVVTPEMLLTGVRYFDGNMYPLPRFYLDTLEKQGFNTRPLRRIRSLEIENGKRITGQEFATYCACKENFLRSFAPRARFLPLLY